MQIFVMKWVTNYIKSGNEGTKPTYVGTFLLGHEKCYNSLDFHRMLIPMSKRVQSYSIVSYLKVKIVHVSWTPPPYPPPKWGVTKMAITFGFSNRIEWFFLCMQGYIVLVLSAKFGGHTCHMSDVSCAVSRSEILIISKRAPRGARATRKSMMN